MGWIERHGIYQVPNNKYLQINCTSSVLYEFYVKHKYCNHNGILSRKNMWTLGQVSVIADF